mgnify:CR=1 FL=1
MNNKITCAHDHRYQFYSYSNLHNKEEVIVEEKCQVDNESEDIRIASSAASQSSETDSQTISSPLQPPPVSQELQPPVSPELQPPVSPELHITEQSDTQTNTQTTTVESADQTAAVVDETEKEADTTEGDTDYITDDRTAAALTDVTDAAGVEIETVTSSDTTEPHADMDNNPRNSAALGGLGTYCTG